MPNFGLAYPFKVNSTKDVAIAKTTQHRRDKIMQVISTRIGERRMLPLFGCRIHELMFENNDEALETLGRVYVIEAIDRWIPEISITGVSITTETMADGSEVVVFTMSYEDRETGTADAFNFGLIQ